MGKKTAGDIVFEVFNYTIMIILAIITLYPFLHVLAVSLNDPYDAIKGGITIFPRKFTLVNYIETLNYPQIPWAVFITVLRTVVGTALGVLSSAMVAYVINRKDFIARKPVSIMFIITMYIGGGLIPEYMLMRGLGLMNNFLVYILPGLISPFNVIVIKSYMEGIPSDVEESAMIDGANDFLIFWKIILPLCAPVIATISLFIAVGHWNSWFDTYLYCSSEPKLTTLQYELQKILSNAAASSQVDYYSNLDPNRTMKVTPHSLRMAMTIIVTMPILFVYPFVQRYFIHGMTIGAVKS
ncbi:carbohydrate ABC transporter membrane protein 2 (CUT1 family) [Caldicellulosiruptor bescii]|uniref:Binding-protein-dependent transport systems inner membrane component n=2 Tax=Caldicellulosiruptor bescii TaxID=31899 RepID=B9MLE0_CALBD|nr:carbohydrate ABC transporter permease [Caldicellulosiruptor bescii]ACM61130.1 binding-protein-dependent transport systems inner membrane component [Caldicellulosiruptor bescii DSM 6725]PBC89057.1 carbohydrate ABC transporter membrane protein 2 (CUT1 family) [Caldicellulosiruptor bescii]PBC91461.1 carbohydrate ABC transporter membrane protein 2 (CUT1 family) [Caldicellulosiruptor bescii]PBD03128.1 carbohydrate ABC transporter membrane protein 2 (CUT1 family) [Caldicellulosiruptor bescii]PBD0